MKRIFLLCLFLTTSLAGMMAQTNSQRPSVLYNEASDLFRKEKFAVAQHLFDQYIQMADASDNDVANATYYAAVCSEQLRNDDALFRISEFMRLYPEHEKINMAIFALGNVYFEKGDYTSALHEYLKVEPSEVEFNHRSEFDYKTGFCYFQNGDKESAKKYFKRVSDGKSYYRNAATYYYADILFSAKQY